jgi:phage protein Gp37/Gp68
LFLVLCCLLMGDQSAIEWTDATWNPVTGCTKISPGCKRPRRGLSRYFLPVKNSLMFSPLDLAPSTMVWPMPVNISLNPGPT